ncbi:hypothetical protein [Paenibacillus artemisiicola]|uniref:hypothetical protein n=1 Tax=Paenibacillus artemisiicola TaxID=1172618 RepID=UPI0030B87FA9
MKELPLGSYEDIIEGLIAKSGSRAAVAVEDRFPGGRLIGGKYAMRSHAVTLYRGVIAEQCMQLFGSAERLREYAAVILAHELGHAEDGELPALVDALERGTTERERLETALRIEENAWRYAEALLPERDGAFFGAIVAESLRPYREALMDQSA